MGWDWVRNRRRIVGAAVGAAVLGAVAVGLHSIPDSTSPVPTPPTTVKTLFSLSADTDFGRLPARTDWCSGADHCWLFGGAATEGSNVVADSDMELAGVTNWNAYIGSSTLAKSTASPHGGAQALRITNGMDGTNGCRQFVLTPSAPYHFTGWARGDGTAHPVVDTGTAVWIGSSSTSWQYFDILKVSTSTSYILYSQGGLTGNWVEFDDVSTTPLTYPTISDSGSGSWDLTAVGSPRTGIVTGVPVAAADGTVDWTGEQAAGLDGAAYYQHGIACDTHSSQATITAVVSIAPTTMYPFIYWHRSVASGIGYYIQVQPNGSIVGAAAGAGGSSTVTSVAGLDDGATHCVSAVIDTSGASLGRIYVDGADATASGGDFSGVGDMTVSGKLPTVGARDDGVNKLSGLVMRIRDDGTALSLSDHQALCGSLGLPARRDHPAASAISWSQSGGARCFDVGSHRAYCVGGGLPAYYYDTVNADYAWAPEQGRINRLATDVDCTTWTCATATEAASVAPDGSKTAHSLTMSGGTVTSPTETGYTASATLYPAFWVKCSSGTLSIVASTGAGDWDVACATASGGDWTLIHSATAAGVTQNTAWAADGSGQLAVQLSGADAEIWNPTWTETQYGLSVIPTGTAAAAVDTGDIVFGIANATGTYWKAGDTVTSIINEIVSPCIVLGSTIYLGGDGTPYCTGGLSSLEITR